MRVGLALTATLLAACTAATSTAPDAPETVGVWLDGSVRSFPEGTTLGDVIRDLGLRPEPGRFLSVSGSVLALDLDPGVILVNGAFLDRQRELRPGDSIQVIDGVDVTEGTERIARILPGRRPTDPQYTLRTYPMKRIAVVGRFSREVVSIEYRPVGKAKRQGMVALTFDDGPWGAQTRRLLKVLKRYHVRATFFMVGSQIQEFPAVARDVLRAGHRVGNHSWSHPQDPVFADLTPHRLETEIAETNRWLVKIGVDPYLLRAPGGSVDEGVVEEARQQGLRVVQWDVDPSDWKDGRTAKEIAASVLRQVRPGSIVLMHDGGGDQSATIKALPAIIRGIRRMGLRFVPIPR